MNRRLNDMPEQNITVAGARSAFIEGVIACGPTILGYWSIGFASGAIGAISGFSISEILLLSALLYAGSAQFLFYSLWTAGAGPSAVVLAVLLVNIRYLLMSSYLARFFSGASTMQKFVSGVLLTDETFGVATQFATGRGTLPYRWMLGLNVAAYANWIVANFMGALFAAVIPTGISHGLGFSLTAMFIGLLALNYFGSARKRLEIVAMVTSAAAVLATMRFLDVNVSVLVATALAATICATALQIRERRGTLS